MEGEEDDDIYDPTEAIAQDVKSYTSSNSAINSPNKEVIERDEDEEEGEEVEEDESDSVNALYIRDLLKRLTLGD